MRADILTTIPLLDLKAQYESIRDEIRETIDRVLESQAFILGPEVEALEREVAAYSQCAHGIGVSSGTDAILISLMALGIRPGEEVITSPYAFFAVAGSIARVGARAVFVDIDPGTYTIAPAAIEAAVSNRTRAIIPVHLFGQMADMDPIMDLARRRQLFVIEDAAQAIGAEYYGRRAGSIGHLGCFSFFPSKNLGGVGDGGMVTTQDAVLADRVALLRNHGHRPKYFNKLIGGNFRLDAIQAAVLRVKLRHLEWWTRARQRNAATYRRLFTEAGLVVADAGDGTRCPGHGVVLPAEIAGRRHIYNQFVVRGAYRDALAAYLKRRAIGTEVYYPLTQHLQECFVDWGYRKGDFPASECASAETLALPIYPELTETMQMIVVDTIADFYRQPPRMTH